MNDTKDLTNFAKDEALAYQLYKMVANRQKKIEHRNTLNAIAEQEKLHLEKFNQELGTNITVEDYSKRKYKRYKLIFKLLGSIFTLRLFEKGEEKGRVKYAKYIEAYPILQEIVNQEKNHANQLSDILKDEKLLYASSIVLGMNDALVEMSGAIAGYTFALADTKQIGIVAAITGVAATLSMASSEFLSAREGEHPHPVRSSLYTGLTYLVVVTLMIIPYLLFSNKFVALGVMLGTVVTIIFVFNLYTSIAKKQSLWKNFGIMVIIALGVSIVSFLIGLLINQVS